MNPDRSRNIRRLGGTEIVDLEYMDLRVMLKKSLHKTTVPLMLFSLKRQSIIIKTGSSNALKFHFVNIQTKNIGKTKPFKIIS